MRLGILFSLAVLSCAATGQSTNHGGSRFDPKPWVEDFHQVLSEMSSHYANLEWAVEERRMDLPRWRGETEGKLREADDADGARKILDKFIAGFGDGHLEIEWPKNDARPKPAVSTPGGLCERLGYISHLHPGLDFSERAEFSLVDAPEAKLFPGGVLRLRNGAVLGVLRIGLFSEHSYPEVCEQAVRESHLAENAACDEQCEDHIQLATANLLTTALVKRAEELRAAGAATLVIDITNNGGGSDWADVPPRVLSSVQLHDSKIGFIQHEHWTKDLQDRLRDVQTDIKNHAGPQLLLAAAASKLEEAINDSKQPCDTTAVWETGKLPCSMLVKNLLFTSGILDYAKPGSFALLESRTELFYPSRYTYAENPKALPLYVVVDRGTWSAAEYFAAVLQDNHAATIVGEVTGGAGCGYTNGGIPATLKNSGAELKMPDCVRYRADGSNEVNGITPDVLLPWTGHDSGFQRVEKLLTVLELRKTASAK